jgi:RNA polymerase sigma factor for flagellar operon FliA
MTERSPTGGSGGLASCRAMQTGPSTDHHDNDPASLYERQNGAEVLAYLVEQLTEGERQVLTGHYYQQLSFVQLSEMMAVSKARVSQLHGQGLKKLRRLYEQVS